jgi:TatD DNase family protein
VLIDSHCHLEQKDYRGADGADLRPEVIARARAAGVTQLVAIGSGAGLSEIEIAIGLARAYAHVHAAVGIHPHDARGADEALWAQLEERAAREERVVAVGETGLDYHYKHSTPSEQRALFRRFIELSRRIGKPLSLHIRDAHEEAQALVREAGGARGVVHCFTGKPDEARAWLALGFYISFSGIVTFKSAAAIQEACRQVPSERLLIETDCPYLSPVPLRGKRNEPAYLVHTAEFVAGLRKIPLAELAAHTREATYSLFPTMR